MLIVENMIFQLIDIDSNQESLQRVLWVSTDQEHVVVVDITDKKKMKYPFVDVKLNFTLFARFLFTLLLKKCFSGFSCDDFPRFHLHG